MRFNLTHAMQQWRKKEFKFNETYVSFLTVFILQYFLNPKVVNEPVPEQLEQIAAEILVPLQVTFHHFADKVLY
jgi:hypothetical protein